MNKQILITGATSGLGRAFVRRVWSAHPDASITLLSWKDEKTLYDALRAELEAEFDLWDGQLTIHAGDVGDSVLGLKETLYEELRQQVTHVVHLAEASRQVMDKETLIQTNVMGSENVAYFASQAPQLVLYLHFSDIGVAGSEAAAFAETEFAHERSFRSLYERSQYEAEESVRTLQHKMPLCVLRMGHVLGERRLQRWLQEARWAAKLPGSPGLGDDTPLHIVDPDAAARAIVDLLDEEAAGKTYHLINQRPLAAQGLFANLMKLAAGRDPGSSWPLGRWNVTALLPLVGGGAALSPGERSAFYQGPAVAAASAEVWPGGADDPGELLRRRAEQWKLL